MKILSGLALSLFLGVLPAPLSAQDDPLPQLSGVAEKFVAAYNEKNLDAILGLYTSEAEMIDEIDALAAAGTDQIRDIYESSFSKYPDRKISLDVLSVRQIASNVVIEEGIARFSGEVPNEEGDAVAYSAVIVKDSEKGWLIASSREISAGSAEPDPMSGLYPLEGDWVMQADQMQMELSLGLSASGRFLIGTALTTTPDAGAMETEIRIGFDPSLSQMRWWTFDEQGGFGQGTWQAIDNGWLVHSNGVTSEGETTSALQQLTFEGNDAIVWDSSHRFVNGEAQPDLQLRLVRRPPAPSLSVNVPEDSSATSPESDPAETPVAAPSNAPKP